MLRASHKFSHFHDLVRVAAGKKSGKEDIPSACRLLVDWFLAAKDDRRHTCKAEFSQNAAG